MTKAAGLAGCWAGRAGHEGRAGGTGLLAWGARAVGRHWAQAGAQGAGRARVRGARPGRACAHGGHAGWVSLASLGFGEPGSVLTQFLTRF